MLSCWCSRCVLGWMQGDAFKYFFHAYLVSFCFYLSISLGALFFVALHHASRAGWSVCVRRVMEIVAANVLLMAVLFLPILAGSRCSAAVRSTNGPIWPIGRRAIMCWRGSRPI